MTRWGWLVGGMVSGLAALAVGLGVVELDVTGLGIDIVAACVMVLGLYAYVTRDQAFERRVESPTAPSLERALAGPPPGGSIEQALTQFRTDGWGTAVIGERLSTDLREAAVTALVHFDGNSRERAEERVDRGEWTDDPLVAAFVGDVDPPSQSIFERFVGLLSAGPTLDESVARTVAAIAAIGNDDPVAVRSSLSGSETTEAAYRSTTKPIDSDVPLEVSSTSTDHWGGFGALTLFVIGAGVLFESPAAVFVGIVALGYVGFSHIDTTTTASMRIERTLERTRTTTDEPVTVTVTIHNEGSAIPDLRFVDGVPAGCSVVDGTPRLATALRSGETTSFSYDVVGVPGAHEFDPAVATVRTLSRSRARVIQFPTSTVLSVESKQDPCQAPLPLRTRGASYTGRMATTDGGEGTEFHSIREYRRSDPLKHVDWRRRARTGELATVQFRVERAVNIVILIDARKEAYVTPPGGDGHALTRSIEAAARIFATLLDAGDSVGLAAIGTDNRDRRIRVEPCWLPPGSGGDRRARARKLLADHPQLSTSVPTTDISWRPQLRELKHRFSAETQVLFVSPLCDGGAVGVARWFDAHGHPVSVVSIDPTGDETSAQQLARVGRRVHVADVRSAGIPVVDWAWDEPLDVALARASSRGGV